MNLLDELFVTDISQLKKCIEDDGVLYYSGRMFCRFKPIHFISDGNEQSTATRSVRADFVKVYPENFITYIDEIDIVEAFIKNILSSTASIVKYDKISPISDDMLNVMKHFIEVLRTTSINGCTSIIISKDVYELLKDVCDFENYEGCIDYVGKINNTRIYVYGTTDFRALLISHVNEGYVGSVVISDIENKQYQIINPEKFEDNYLIFK